MVCLCVVAGMLFAGLWPFGSPRNGVHWLAGENGLRFSANSLVLSNGLFNLDQPPKRASLEIWLKPERANISSPFLVFLASDKLSQLSLQQYFSLLVLNDQHLGPTPVSTHVGVERIFRQSKPVFLTITAGQEHTAIYADGALARIFPNHEFEQDMRGRLLLGTSPDGSRWPGELKGLAIYRSELSAAAVLRHYQGWIQQGRPPAAMDEHAIAVYLFQERHGSIGHNLIAGPSDLHIPESYMRVRYMLLEPFWKEYRSGISYWKDVAVNIAGFIPLGFLLYWYWSWVKPCPWALRMTVLSGFLVSLTIEILQSFLPTRNSGTTDLITNTLGTFLGIMLHRIPICGVLVAHFTPRLSHRTRGTVARTN